LVFSPPPSAAAPEQTGGLPRAHPARSAAVAALAVFVVALGLSWAFTRSAPLINDTDSYYHLAVARELAREGVPEELPWARFSLLRSPFADKELLFHWALAPFAPAQGTSTEGGRLALALFVALVLGVVAWQAAELAGPAAALVALALPVLALDLTDRLNRLRPELVALVLFLLAARAVARRADRTVGVLAFLFALSYTAIQAFAGMVGSWWLLRWRRDGRPSWGLLLYTALGTAIGLAVHPAFPANLELWAVVNLHLFDFVGSLDAGGAELRPATTAAVLTKNLGFWAAAALALLAGRSSAPAAPDRALARDVHAMGAAVFGLLYLAMWRFGLYFFPFAALALVAHLGTHGIATRVRLGRWRVPVAAAWLLCVLAAVPQGVAMARHFLAGPPGPAREDAWRAFSQSVPAGAKVAAPWGMAQAYFFFAPQGRYLNFLDPVLMAFPYPRQEALARAVFAGTEPDLALAVGGGLDSDYLAFSTLTAEPLLVARAEGDPRLHLRHAGYDRLYALDPAAVQRFVRDWQVAAPGRSPAPYPRHRDARASTLEAFVDGRRVGPGCLRFAGRWAEPEGASRWMELAPYGPTRLALDGRPLVAIGGSPGAVLGQGALVQVALAAGEHVWTVESCPDPATGRSGFFLLDRGAGD
jgi:hypothetical protein